MEAVLVVVNAVLILVALVLIVVVLLQQGNTANLGAISGGAETFFGKNKAKSYEGKLALITKVCATLFIVLAITATALQARINNVSTQTPVISDPVVDVVDDTTDVQDDAPVDTAEQPPEADPVEATPVPEEDPAA